MYYSNTALFITDILIEVGLHEVKSNAVEGPLHFSLCPEASGKFPPHSEAAWERERIQTVGSPRFKKRKAGAHGVRRRPPCLRDGYELRRPGTLLRVHGEEPRVARKEGLHRSRRPRQARRQTETRIDGHQDRSPDAGTGRVSGELERRDLEEQVADRSWQVSGAA